MGLSEEFNCLTDACLQIAFKSKPKILKQSTRDMIRQLIHDRGIDVLDFQVGNERPNDLNNLEHAGIYSNHVIEALLL